MFPFSHSTADNGSALCTITKSGEQKLGAEEESGDWIEKDFFEGLFAPDFQSNEPFSVQVIHREKPAPNEDVEIFRRLSNFPSLETANSFFVGLEMPQSSKLGQNIAR